MSNLSLEQCVIVVNREERVARLVAHLKAANRAVGSLVGVTMRVMNKKPQTHALMMCAVDCHIWLSLV